MKDVAKQYDVEKYIKYKHSIRGATWNEGKSKWEIRVENEDGVVFADECDVFINASGVLK